MEFIFKHRVIHHQKSYSMKLSQKLVVLKYSHIVVSVCHSMFYSHNNRACPKANSSMSMITSPWVILQEGMLQYNTGLYVRPVSV